jgi:peroxiredoxin Q/BCP
MCSLRDAAGELAELDAAVYGLSLDDVASLAAFAEDQALEFPLLSDPDGSVARKYGVLAERGWAERVTFVLAPDGAVELVDTGVDVSQHGADLVGKLRELQGR